MAMRPLGFTIRIIRQCWSQSWFSLNEQPSHTYYAGVDVVGSGVFSSPSTTSHVGLQCGKPSLVSFCANSIGPKIFRR
ncbi:hypothetical protein GGX14DRAFT_429915 [Mycena pura]|uniref:Uncharacterized protein n=1 Tax=Mycena pura TaxID=153505 RepID=A0AAD6VSK9_9AGAR|nr:hypothetical protein GGX14DRAFT_429915 [Mycena pura]